MVDSQEGVDQVNSVGMFRRLATLDLGVILLPEEVAAEDVVAGRLRRVLPGGQANPTPVYALTKTRLLPAKTQRFIEFLQERLGQQARPTSKPRHPTSESQRASKPSPGVSGAWRYVAGVRPSLTGAPMPR
ncbi:LysR substrate binding domain-containing protein [Variovorax sp. CF079]|nr:LysR substrate binding domain-containing protein [Variovorax sp. CF079]